MPVSGEHYWQDENDLWVENVGPWAKEKQKIITDYVQISSATRKKYTHCAFLDVFSGPGQSKIRTTGELIDGSPVAALKQSLKSAPFSKIYISDADEQLLQSATTRMRGLGAQVEPIKGPASRAIAQSW
jgi:three-Cys-motif partner protein